MSTSLAYKLDRLKSIIFPNVNIIPLPDSITVNQDVPIKMRDGQFLYANIYLPTNLTSSSTPIPVIMSAHPYSKDVFSKRGLFFNYYDLHFRALRMPSTVTFSEYTSWEAPDPGKTTKNKWLVLTHKPT